MRKAFILKTFDPTPNEHYEDGARYCFTGRYVGEWPDQFTSDYNILELDAWDNETGELVFRHFVNFEKEEYWTFAYDDLFAQGRWNQRPFNIESGKWTEARIDTILSAQRRIEHGDHDHVPQWIIDEVNAEDSPWYQAWESEPLGKLAHWEMTAQTHRAERRTKVRYENIREMFKDLPEAEEEVYKWGMSELFTHYVFIADTGKTHRLTCTACMKGWNKKIRPKYGSEITCPFCGKTLKVTRKKYLQEKIKVYKCEPFADGAVIRHFDIEREWRKRGGRWQWGASSAEVQRALVGKDGHWKRSFYAIGYSKQSGYTFADHKCWGVNIVTGVGYLYPKDIYYPSRSETDLMIYRLLAESRLKDDWNGVELKCSNIPEYVEYLLKSGLKKIGYYAMKQGWAYHREDAKDLLNETADNLPALLQLDSNMTARVKRMDIKPETLRYLQEHPGHISDQTIKLLDKVGAEDLMLSETGLTVTKVLNYISKQTKLCGFKSDSETKTMYRDYINMAIDNGEDPHDDIVRLCRDLRQRHDALVEAKNITEQKKRFLNCKGVKRRYKPYHAIYGWTDGNYTVTVPKKPEEIFEEGQKQHHCVGSGKYMEEHAAGKTLILFLRSVKKPEKPWYTVEVDPRNLNIRQRYGKYDRQPNLKKADAELKKWKKDILTRLRRPNKAVREALETLKAM